MMLDRPSPTTDTWTEERIETLTTMWMAGKSAGEIAFVLGNDISRSAVIGKVHRLELTRTGRPAAKPTPAPRKAMAVAPPRRPGNGAPGQAKAASIVHRAQRRPPVLPEFVPSDGVDFTDRLGLMDVGAHQCHWIEGDPMTPNHSFCGDPVKPGTRWCPSHYARVYTPR